MEKKQVTSVVTGANGFVGSHLVDLLLDKGHKVKCIVRNSSNLRWLKGKDAEIFDCGLFDKGKLADVLKDADYLFHIAGVVKSKKDEGYIKGNVETTKNLLEVIEENQIPIKRVVVLSSQTAGGPSLNGKHITEADTPKPITRYGRSKLAQEEMAKSFMDRIPISIVRPPAIYGERDTEVYLVFKTYYKGLMSLIGFNDKRLSILHVHDVVNGAYLASQAEKAAGEVYYVGSEKYYSWLEVADAIKKATGKKAVVLRLPHFLVYTVAVFAQFFSIFSSKAATFNIEKARDFVQQYWTCDISKAKNDLGYKQEVSLEEGIKRTIDWYKAEKWL